MGDVFGGSLPSLLVDQVEIAECRFLVGVHFEQCRLGDKFVGGGNGVVAGTGNLSRSVFGELVVIELEQADIRAGALLRIKVGFDLGNRSHKTEIQAERIGRALDLLDRRSDRDIFERVQYDVGGLSLGRQLRIDIIGEIGEVRLARRLLGGMILNRDVLLQLC